MRSGAVHGEPVGTRAGFLAAFVGGESSSSRLLLEPNDRSKGPFMAKVTGSLMADLLRFRTGDAMSSDRFLVLKSRTALSALATRGDFSGGVIVFTGNRTGGGDDDDDDVINGDEEGTMVAKRGGTGWKTEATVSSPADSNDSPEEHRFSTGGGGVLDNGCESDSLMEVGLSSTLQQQVRVELG